MLKNNKKGGVLCKGLTAAITIAMVEAVMIMYHFRAGSADNVNMATLAIATCSFGESRKPIQGRKN